MQRRSLLSGFLKSVQHFASRPALVVDGAELSYRELADQAARICFAIRDRCSDEVPVVALLAYRSATAYAGILGILAAGRGYVPLNPKFPTERTRKMLWLCGATSLVVGAEAMPQLFAVLSGFERKLTVILPDQTDATDLIASFPHHEFISEKQLSTVNDLPSVAPSPSSVAYLLFTSGSTGEPKGVPISQASTRSYVEYIADRYAVNERDRFSQEFDLTFDLSVHDMFVCWERGAALHCVPEKSVMLPAKFIRDHQITMWFSVPSVAGMLAKMRLLRPGTLPSLRASLFCGEPLSAEYARMWQEAAPNSILENLYGPTETTIAISHYRWNPERSPQECLNGIVPIGWIFDGQQGCLVDEERRIVPDGQCGELCLAGSQVTSGYWNNPEKTREQFMRLPDGGETVWYRTGDLCRRRADGCLLYLGRTDHQVKIRGYRVELQEIDLALRKLCETEEVVSMPWPVNNGSADGVVAFVSGTRSLNPEGVLDACRRLLPDYMVPKKIYLLENMPLSGNGKTDRKALAQLLGGS